jgi:hypothetical protein
MAACAGSLVGIGVAVGDPDQTTEHVDVRAPSGPRLTGA